jgi:hypothetical protein
MPGSGIGRATQDARRVLDELEEEDHIPMLITDVVGKSERG